MPITHQVYLGFGSNIKREYYLSKGLARIVQDFSCVQVSPVYESEAHGFNGPCFYNFVVALKTNQSLTQMHSALKQIELDFDRPVNAQKKASRTLDIDILFFDDLVCSEPCELPRAEVLQNAFVLKPLFDIAPQLIHPVSQLSIAKHWNSFDQTCQALTRVDASFLEEAQP